MNLLAIFRNEFQEIFKIEVCSICRSESQINKKGRHSRQGKGGTVWSKKGTEAKVTLLGNGEGA